MPSTAAIAAPALDRHLENLLLDVPKITGSYDWAENACFMEESLTPEECVALESFFGWLVANDLAYGHGNLRARWEDWEGDPVMSRPENIRFEDVGRFEVKSGSLTVSDPAYHPGTWCAGRVRARNGWWDAGMLVGRCGEWGERVLMLVAAAPHVDAFRLTELALHGVLVDSEIDVGVDSGSCGLYDSASYHKPNEKALEDLPPHARAALDDYIAHVNKHLGGHEANPWHDLNAAYSLSKAHGGAFDGGCVASSGYGDGSYRCLVRLDGDEVIGAVVVFIDPKEDCKSW